ncbi:MAG: glycosyl transferase [Patescibacteria group bacterium]|nr:glycosyl transferase [Patescibacteria group bacterium]
MAVRSPVSRRRISLWMLFFVAIYAVLIVKLITFQQYQTDPLFNVYSITISLYILSRFVLAYYYDAAYWETDPEYVPTVTFGVPSKNEAAGIRSTIMGIAAADYPKDRFNIVVVNDGSTDDTLAEMYAAQKEAQAMGVAVEVVDWAVNRGKREGMAECIRRSDHEIIIFIDSDSLIEPETTREMVKYFTDPKIGAVTAHGYVANAEKNLLTKMQAMKYFVSFRAYKGAESLFGCVTCCSGCGAAYRRESLTAVVDEWRQQRFLGALCTFGDDRALTNLVLRQGLKAVYASEARVYTKVPESWRVYMTQQMRWKKSWIRESLRASLFMWRKHPIMAVSYYVGLILPFLAPLVILRAVVYYPSFTHHLPVFYLFGLGLMGLIYGLYYRLYTDERDWVAGTLATSFFAIVLIAQFPYALANIRDGRWGTR